MSLVNDLKKNGAKPIAASESTRGTPVGSSSAAQRPQSKLVQDLVAGGYSPLRYTPADPVLRYQARLDAANRNYDKARSNAGLSGRWNRFKNWASQQSQYVDNNPYLGYADSDVSAAQIGSNGDRPSLKELWDANADARKARLDAYKSRQDAQAEYNEAAFLKEYQASLDKYRGNVTGMMNVLQHDIQKAKERGDTAKEKELQSRYDRFTQYQNQQQDAAQRQGWIDEYNRTQAGYDGALADYDAKLARYQELMNGQTALDPTQDPEYQEYMREVTDWADENLQSGEWTRQEYNNYLTEQEDIARQQYDLRVQTGGSERYYAPDAEIQQAAQELERARFVLDYARANRDSGALADMAVNGTESAEEGLSAYEEDSANPIVSDEDRQAHEQYLADQRAFYESMGLSGDTLERALAADDEQWMRQYGNTQANASKFDPRYNQDYASPDERWSDSERYLFGYYWQNVGEERAREYAAELNRKYNAAEAAERDLETEEFATRNAGTAALATAGAIGGHMLGGNIDFARMAAENAYRGDLYETQYEGISRWGDVATGAIAQDLNSKWGTIDESVPVLGGKGWGDVYQLFESMAESGASIAVGGETGSLAMFFGMAAASGTRDALDRGLDSDRALLTGLVNGIAEVAGEKLSVENLLSNNGLSDFLTKGVWHEVLKQGGVEASEETLTTLLNTMADLAINGDQSEVETSVYNYMLQGMTREEARKAALKDWINQLGQDALGGFLSGSVMSGAHYSAFAGPALATRYDGNAQGMLDYAALLDQNSQAAQVADRYRPGFEKKGSISNYAAARMMASFGEDVSGDEVQRAKSSIEESFGSVEAAKTAAEGVENADAETQQKVIELAENFGMKQSGNQPGLKAKGPNEAQRAAQRVLQVTKALENMENRRSEREAAGMREAAEHSIPKEKAVTLEDGGKITMARYDGTTGAVTVSVQNGDGDARLMDRSELSGESAQLFDDLEDALGNTAQAVEAFNQMQDGQDARYYGTDFRTMRELGQRGANLDNALKNYRGVLTEEQARRAYQMGQGMTRREGGKPIRTSAAGTGKVSLDGGMLNGQMLQGVKDKAALQSSADYKLVQKIAKALSVDVVFYESRTDADGNFVGAQGAYHGGVIYLDINAGMNRAGVGERMFFTTMSHELTHFIKENAPARYDELQERVVRHLMQSKGVDFNGLVRSKMARAEGRMTYDGAVEEVIADSCETMLRDSKAVLDLAQNRPSLFRTMKQYIDRFASKILAGHAEAKALQPIIQDVQKIWDRALTEAVANRNVGYAEQEAVWALGEDAEAEYNRKGELFTARSEDGSTVVYSERTYKQGGRDKLMQALKDNGHTEEEIRDTVQMVDDALDYLKILAAGYAQNMGYNNLSDHLAAEVTTYIKSGQKATQALSTLVNNGEYPVNLDLALICKKRVAYMRMMSRLIEDGVFDKVTFGGSAIAEVNTILRNNGFETACLGCFVESRRLQLQNWAETIVEEWNLAVDNRKAGAEYFGFSEGLGDFSEGDIQALVQELEGAGKKNAKGNLNLGTGSVAQKMERLMDKVPSLRKKLTVADLLKPEGLTALRSFDQNLFSLVKQRYGAASPKIVQDFNPYNSEIADLTFKFVKDMTGNAVKGAQQYLREARKELGKRGENENKAAYDKRVNTLAMQKYLYNIGGARIQSFSDFMIENVFDYLQIFADLSARKLPLHGYTKEQICLRLFGMTGAKFNGSLIAHVESSMGKEYAGLLPVEEASRGRGVVVTVDGKQYAICADDYARHAATGSFIQSIGLKDVVALQLDPRYSANVGSITIGVSDKQILAMLDSDIFRMIIPYHASGMLPEFAKLVGVDNYNDYTEYQNTTVKQCVDLNGKVVDGFKDKSGKPIKIDTGYAFNEAVQRLGDARAAANEYIAWCAEQHPVYDGKTLVGYATFNPKFSNSPYGTDFSRHPNYYKLLEDFNSYDRDGRSALQGAVTMTLPSEATRLTAQQMEEYRQALRDSGLFSEKDIEKYARKADMTFQELIAEEVQGRAGYESAQAKVWDETIREVEDTLLNKYPSTRAERQAARNKNAAPEGDVMYSNREEALNHKGVDWMGDFTSIKEQLAKHRGEISQMAPLAEVTYLGEEKKALERLILDQLAQIGGPRMVRDGITFDFDQKGAEHIVLHAKSDELRAAALAAPYVAKYGKLISGQKNHENTNTTTLTYAAPVRINGEAVNVGVVIHFASNGRPRAVNVETENGGVFKINKTAQGLRSRTGKSQVLQLLTRTVSTDRIAQGDGEVKYSFGGRMAETADDRLLRRAEEMEKRGESSETIRKETGWFRGMDDEWRFEIDNKEMSIIDAYSPDRDSYKLSELVSHDKLYEAYPALADYSVEVEDLDAGLLGQYVNYAHKIIVSRDLFSDKKELRKTLVHEIQHAIQAIEGFAYGSSPAYWRENMWRRSSDLRNRMLNLTDELRTAEGDLEDELFYSGYEQKKREVEGRIWMSEISQAEGEKELQDWLQKHSPMGFDLLQQVEQMREELKQVKADLRKSPSAGDLYKRTAGEIEARDVEKRLNLDEKKRQEKRPDIDRKNVVFAKYSERDNAKTDRELLMETNGEELTEAERVELGKYRAKAEEVRERERKVQAALDEMDKMVRARDPNVQKQRTKVSNLQAGLNKALRELTQAETGNKTMLEIIRKEREIQRRRTNLATRETFTKRDLRGRITKLYNDLNRRITSPSEKKNIPVPVMEQAVEVLSAINMDSTREGSRAGEKLRQKLLDLQAKYRELENDPDFRQAAVYDATVAELMQNMVQAVGDTPINRMNASQMKAVLDALTVLDKTARTALKIKMLGEERDAYQVARQMGEETRSVKKPHKNLLAQWLNAQLSPERMFNRLGGYHKDSAWSQVYRMLNDGQLKMTQIQMEGTMLFDGLMEGKDYDKFIDPKNTVDIGLKDRSGNAVPITHGMMAALYMHLQNEQNAKHVAHGGLTVPNLKDYYNGRNNRGLDSTVLAVGVSQEIGDLRDQLKDAKSEEEKDRIRDQIREVEESAAAYIQGLRASIERQLTAYDRQWIAAAKELFDVYSKQRLNEATMEVYGIKRANVENYFPLSVNKDFLNTPFESIAKDMSLENAGFMKERVDSGKPIYLFDVGDVAKSQIRRVSQYCGLMPVTRNFQKIWGKVQTGYRGSLQDDVREKFGSAGIQYVENLMADLNGARGGSEGPLADFFNAVRGNMAQASLTLSLRVAMGQTASYPTAASVVGWKALGRALAQGGRGNTVISRADQELIRKYSPLLWYRMKGYSTTELGDLANSHSRSARLWQKMRWATGWIQAMDGATVGRLWYAAQYYVEDRNKALQKGTDAYYREVAKVFNDIVEKTQPDYTTMQRPDILRNPNALVKQLTMFLTQRLQNFNILYDAAASYGQARKDLAAGVRGVTQHDVLEARTTVRRAAVSQLVAAATITAFKMAADVLLHSMKAYRDDDEELTGESISIEALDMFLDSLAGNILGGGEVFDIIEKYAFGKTYYGIDVSGVSTVTDVVEAANKFLDEALTEGATAKDVWDKGGHKLAKNIASLLGVPYANGEKIVMGLIYHATDIVNGEFGHFEAGVDRTTAQEAHRLYRAYTADNYGTVKKIREQVGDDDKLNQALAAHIKQQYGDGAITEKQAVEQLQKFAGKDRKTAEKTMREYSAEVETGIKYARIGEELVAGNLSEAEAVKMWQKYGGMELEKAQSKASWTLYQNDHPDTTLEASSYATWFYKYRSILDAELYEDYYSGIKSCKGTDNNGDGKTDSGSAKAQKLLVIDALPISSDKKDALYRANGWSEKTLKDAPWHKR